ncbi:MAG: SAM-dependent methyltransferase [Planctomycetia bacterium]|nr:SAM-dependent methyltransferase [Planctomycetia bacterium]
MMTLEAFRALLTSAGQIALLDAVALGPTESAFLACFETLRKRHPPELAKAALETALLRIKAREKFAAAERMYFTRESLEVSTNEIVARHRARRFAEFEQVADLCCGIGGDALALAAVGLIVEAVDCDPLRVAMAEANASAIDLKEQIHFHTGDALSVPLPELHGAFADPARRVGGRRHLDPEDYTPPLSAIRARFPLDFPLGVKIAPGVAWRDLFGIQAEREFVSLCGELKECVLWFGPLRTTARRATVLPEGETLFAEEPASLRPISSIREVLYDPDPAVTRAGLIPNLAERLDTQPIDAEVQLLTSAHCIPTPFATAFAVELSAPFHARRLRDYLRERSVGRITPIKRGSSLDTNELMKKLKLDGPNHRTVFLTRAAGESVMVVCERVEK